MAFLPRAKTQGRWRNLFLRHPLLLLAPIMLAIGGYGMFAFERQSMTQVGDRLDSEVERLNVSLGNWLNERRDDALVWASDREVQARAAGLAEGDRETLPLRQIERLERAWRTYGYVNAAIVSLDGVTLDSMSRDGAEAPPPAPEIMARVRGGETVSYLWLRTPPTETVSPPGAGNFRALLLFDTPIYRDGAVVAVFRLIVAADTALSHRLGFASGPGFGNFYLFDAFGRVLATTRHEDDIAKLGPIPQNHPPTTAPDLPMLRDPGRPLTGGSPVATFSEQPLTRMAQSATRGYNGVDTDGYRDHFGVDVVGAWRWLSQPGLGIAYEVERRVAFAPLETLRYSLLALVTLLLVAIALAEFLHQRDRRTRQALTISERRFRSFFEAAPSGFFRATASGLITEANPALLRLLGAREPGELIGRDWFDFHEHPEHAAADRAMLAQGQPIAAREIALRALDGRRLVGHVSLAAIDDAEAVSSVFGSVVDVSDRKAAERELTLARSNYELAQRTLAIGCWDWTIGAPTMRCSAESFRLLGLPVPVTDNPSSIFAGEVSLKAFVNAIHPEDRQRVEEAVRATRKERAPYDVEYRVVQRDGSIRVVHAKGAITTNGPDEPEVLYGFVQDITSRRDLDFALRDSEARLKLTQRFARLAGWESDPLERISRVSSEIFSIYGLPQPPASHGGWITVSWEQVEAIQNAVLPADRPLIAAARERSLETGEPYSIDYRISWPDGTIHHIHSEAEPVRNLSGVIYLLRGFTQDVTEHRQTEEALRRSQEILMRVQTIAGMGTWHLDTSTRTTVWSPEMFALYGLPQPAEGATERLGFLAYPAPADVLGLIHPGDLERLKALARRVLKSGAEFHCEFRVVRPDGTTREVHAQGVGALDGSGRVTAVFGYQQDITERKLAQAALGRSHDMLIRAQAIAGLGHWQYDLAKRQLWGSLEAFRILGLAPEHPDASLPGFVGWVGPGAVARLVHPEDRERYETEFATLLRIRLPHVLDFRIIRPDGDERHLHTEGDVLLDATGESRYAFGFLQDISERRRTEMALRTNEARLKLSQQMARLASWEAFPNLSRARIAIEMFPLFDAESPRTPIGGWVDLSEGEVRQLLFGPQTIDAEAAYRQRIDALAGKVPYDFSMEVRTREGKTRYLRSVGEVVRDELGNVKVVRGFTQDVTPEREAELELRSGMALLKLSQRLARMATWEIDVLRSRLSVSLEWFELFEVPAPADVSAEGLSPLPLATLDRIMEHTHPEDREATRLARARALAGEAPYCFGFRYRASGTHWREFQVQGETLHDAEGRVTLVRGYTQDITERRRVEAALRASEKRLRRLFDTTIVGLASWQTDGTMTDANAAFMTLVGIDREAVAGRRVNWRKLTPPEWHAQDDARMAELGNGGNPAPYEKVLLHADGRCVPVLVAVGLWETGGNEGFAFIIDLTAQKAAQRARERSEQTLLKAQRIAKLGSWEYVAAEHQSYWSEAMSDIYQIYREQRQGRSGHVAIGERRHFLERIHPADRARVLEAHRVAWRGEHPLNIDYRIVLDDHSEKVIHVEAENVYDESGQFAGMHGFAQDVTERVRTEQALRRSQESLAVAQRIARIGSWEYDFAAREGYWSEQMCRICGIEPKVPAPGRLGYWLVQQRDEFLRLVHPADLARVSHAERLAKRKQEPYSIEYRIILDSGEVRMLHVEVEFVIAGDAVAGLRGYAQDVTEVRRRENEREALLAELERTNKELESVFYVTTHDLRSPMVNIVGFASRLEKAATQLRALLEKATLPEAERNELLPLVTQRIPNALGFIKASGAKMDALISGLLRVSRTGRQVPRPTEIDMNALVADCLKSVAFQLDAAGAQTGVADLPPCIADRDQISQVLSNLIDNAIKYRDPDRRLKITISADAMADAITYRISDNGRGIAPEHQDKVWDLFHRLDPSGDVPGEGLGLALVRRLVVRNHGRVMLESRLGIGSTFMITLPSIAAADTAPDES